MALMAFLRLVCVSVLQSSKRLLLWRSEVCGFWFSRNSLSALVGKLGAFGKVAVLMVGESRGCSDAISVSALRLRDSGCCCCCCGVGRICWADVCCAGVCCIGSCLCFTGVFLAAFGCSGCVCTKSCSNETTLSLAGLLDILLGLS